MNYLVRRNPYIDDNLPVGSLADTWEQITGRDASKDFKRAKRAVSPALRGGLGNLAQQLQSRAQHLAEVEATSLVNTLINEIPNEQEMAALGDEIGVKIREAIRDNVLPMIYKRVDEAVTSTQGLGFISEPKRLEIYSKITQKLPKNKTIDVQGVKFTISIERIFQKALPFDKFSRIFDRVNPLIENVKEQAKDAAIETGKNVAVLIAFNSFILGGLVTYGFIKLYNSAK